MTTRVVNIRKTDEDYVYIGRGSRWGNPFPIREGRGRAEVIEMYRKWLWSQIKSGMITKEALLTLEGQVLGCYCSPSPCHGDVLVAAIKWVRRTQKSPN